MVAFTVPAVHHWRAGDEMNATRMTELANAIEWLRNPAMVRVARTLSTQAIAINTWTSISFDTVVNSYDPWGFFNAATPTQVTCPVPGWYMVEVSLTWETAPNVDSRLVMGVWKQSAETLLRWDQQGLPNVGGDANMRKEVAIFLNVGDTVQLRAHVNAGARNIVNSPDGGATMRLRWVSN